MRTFTLALTLQTLVLMFTQQVLHRGHLGSSYLLMLSLTSIISDETLLLILLRTIWTWPVALPKTVSFFSDTLTTVHLHVEGVEHPTVMNWRFMMTCGFQFPTICVKSGLWFLQIFFFPFCSFSRKLVEAQWVPWALCSCIYYYFLLNYFNKTVFKVLICLWNLLNLLTFIITLFLSLSNGPVHADPHVGLSVSCLCFILLQFTWVIRAHLSRFHWSHCLIA
jgi:hypothetical protein